MTLILSVSTMTFGQNITVVYPNGGENWEAKKTPYIKWQTESTSNVTIEYSADNGINWNSITTVPASSKTYYWTIPSNISNQCKVRVSTGTNTDDSDANFSIIANNETVYRIVVLGSSTAAGTGPTNVNNAWVWMYRDYLTQLDTRYEVINLALGGTTTYNILPTGTAIPTGVTRTVDVERNITKALQLNANGIIVNMPSNDAASNYSSTDQVANYHLIQNTATAQNIPLWIASPQPRNFGNKTQLAIQLQTLAAIPVEFGDSYFDFWNDLALANGDVNPLYNSGDGVHLNNAGHQILLKKIIEKGIHTRVKTKVTENSGKK